MACRSSTTRSVVWSRWIGGGKGPWSHPSFAAAHEAPYDARGRLQLRVVLDGSSVEVFVGDGRVTITDLIFPLPTSTGLRLLAGRGAHVHRLEVAELRTEVAQQAP
jgi:sucrose-6-phosphate hydrolase SacC (GH32 family)